MTAVVTYHSANAKPHEAWLAYVVMPDGNQWSVRFAGSTEEEASNRAIALWESERAKCNSEPEDPWANAGRGAHFLGKTWLINVASREKIRIDKDKADELVATGEWERGGPRSK